MIVTYEEEYLRQLYEDGRCKDKKHRYQPDIVRRYQKAIRFLITASSIKALWPSSRLIMRCLWVIKPGVLQ